MEYIRWVREAKSALNFQRIKEERCLWEERGKERKYLKRLVTGSVCLQRFVVCVGALNSKLCIIERELSF